MWFQGSDEEHVKYFRDGEDGELDPGVLDGGARDGADGEFVDDDGREEQELWVEAGVRVP